MRPQLEHKSLPRLVVLEAPHCARHSFQNYLARVPGEVSFAIMAVQFLGEEEAVVRAVKLEAGHERQAGLACVVQPGVHGGGVGQVLGAP